MTTIFLLYDRPWLSLLTDGNRPLAALSHDQILFQFGHESLRKGFDVYIEATHEARRPEPLLKVTQFFPVMKLEQIAAADRVAIVPDLVFCTFPVSLHLRALYPASKIIGIVPAMNIFEYPERPSAGWVFGFMEAARSQIDYYITQNTRMAEIARCLFRYIARTELRDRILICSNGIVAEERKDLPPRSVIRAEMGLGPDDVAFVNAGGAWSWTDYNTFLRAFCNVARAGASHIKFYILGFKQPENTEHEESVNEAKAIVAAHADLIGRNLIVCEDWYEASAKVQRYVHAADIGVNVTKDTIENWQSYRARFLDYMKAGIPVINTTGDDLSTHAAADAVYAVQTGNIASYEAAIRLAAHDPGLRQQKAVVMRRCAESFDSRIICAPIIDKLLALPRRDFSNPQEVFEPSLFNHPRPEITYWQPPTLSQRWQEFCGAWRSWWKKPAVSWSCPTAWQDGDGPVLYDIPALQDQDTPLEINFTLKMLDEVFTNWAEVIQIGNRPEQARLIIYVTPIRSGIYRLVLRCCDAAGTSVKLVTPDISIGAEIACAVTLSPARGHVRLRMNKRVWDNATLSPWHWRETTQIWLGSRRLPAALGAIHLKARK